MRLGLSLFILFFCLGCRKSDSGPYTQAFIFTNTTGRTIILDLYKTKSDYNNNKKLVQRLTIQNEANASLNLEPWKTYYIDWYSDDFALSNWQNNKLNGIATPELKFEADTAATNINIALPEGFDPVTYNRRLLLNGNKIEQLWKAVAFYKEGTSENIWSILPDYLKYFQINVEKTFYASMNYKDSVNKLLSYRAGIKVYVNSFVMQFNNANYLKAQITAVDKFNFDTLKCVVSDAGPTRNGTYLLIKN